MQRYLAVIYTDNKQDISFSLRSHTADEAVARASQEALDKGCDQLFLETSEGKEIHNGKIRT